MQGIFGYPYIIFVDGVIIYINTAIQFEISYHFMNLKLLKEILKSHRTSIYEIVLNLTMALKIYS